MILENGCNITKSENLRGSEYFPYSLYIYTWLWSVNKARVVTLFPGRSCCFSSSSVWCLRLIIARLSVCVCVCAGSVSGLWTHTHTHTHTQKDLQESWRCSVFSSSCVFSSRTLWVSLLQIKLIIRRFKRQNKQSFDHYWKHAWKQAFLLLQKSTVANRA